MTTENGAPLSIGAVTLTVNDLDGVSRFYRDVIGLTPLKSEGTLVQLGAGERMLVELRGDPAARRHSRREAGLFHTAFLLPSRADLGRWVTHAADLGVRLTGASDHLVSEALYLDDPEGNGIEIYADRPRSAWRWTDGEVEMRTERLDLEELVRSAGEEPWRGFPVDGVVGHVHLQVGAIPEAEAFYASAIGLDITTHYPGATFYSSGGYHHHIATNIWNSRGAGPRNGPATGLADVEIIAAEPALLQGIRSRAGEAGLAVEEQASGLRLLDPWGTAVTVTARMQ